MHPTSINENVTALASRSDRLDRAFHLVLMCSFDVGPLDTTTMHLTFELNLDNSRNRRGFSSIAQGRYNQKYQTEDQNCIDTV